MISVPMMMLHGKRVCADGMKVVIISLRGNLKGNYTDWPSLVT